MTDSNSNIKSLSKFKRKQLRSFFHTTHQKQEFEDTLESIENQLVHLGMKYILMELSVSSDEEIPILEENIEKSLTEESKKAFVRKASLEDLKVILNLYNRAWTTSQTPMSIITYEALKEIYEDPETVIFIANHKGVDVGFIIIDQDDPDKNFGTIEGLGILPRFQGRGFGKRLGLAAWEHFKQKNVKKLRCEVYKDNVNSYQFVKSLGFKEYDQKVYHLDDFFLKYKSD